MDTTSWDFDFWYEFYSCLYFESLLNFLATSKATMRDFKIRAAKFEQGKKRLVLRIRSIKLPRSCKSTGFVFGQTDGSPFFERDQKKFIEAGSWLNFFNSCTLIAEHLIDPNKYLIWNDHPNIIFPNGVMHRIKEVNEPASKSVVSYVRWMRHNSEVQFSALNFSSMNYYLVIPHLRKLNLKGFYLGHSILNKMNMLEELDLEKCNITNREMLVPRLSLKKISLCECEWIDTSIFSSPNLSCIKLYGSDIDFEILFKNKFLEELHLSNVTHNADKSIEVTPELVSNLSHIKILVFKNVMVDTIWQGFYDLIPKLPNLTNLKMQVSKQYHLDVVCQCKNLISLSLISVYSSKDIYFPDDFDLIGIKQLRLSMIDVIYKSSKKIFDLDHLILKLKKIESLSSSSFCLNIFNMIKSTKRLTIRSNYPEMIDIDNPEFLTTCYLFETNTLAGIRILDPKYKELLDKITVFVQPGKNKIIDRLVDNFYDRPISLPEKIFPNILTNPRFLEDYV
jgi:hypothetical protein